MQEAEFAAMLHKLQPWTDYLYFHLMGEPLCHPNLEKYLSIANQMNFRVILTTNGTLLHKHQTMLLSSPALHKINISLHAFEANDLKIPMEEYLESCFRFGQAAAGQKIVVYRLWNNGGQDQMNAQIHQLMKQHFPSEWVPERKGTRIASKVYLEDGDKFDWPDLSVPEDSCRMYCYGLRDQLGILCDGTVVPCCLDHEGDIPLGNLLTEEFEDILRSPRAKAIYDGFSRGIASETLCRRCGYAKRFAK
jgi:MoaA/NifB/PqqE/SkfB family radical SAM enzyme